MTDFIVIGGGMAGVSAAAFLSSHGSVRLLEMEQTLAYHTTGRSAAIFVINYGGQGVRPLAIASRPFLESPPEGTTDAPLLSPRGMLWIADESQLDELEVVAAEGQAAGAGTTILDAAQALELFPLLSPGAVAGGLLEPTASDIDVAGLHQAFVRLARRQGVEISTGARVEAIRRARSGSWEVTASGVTHQAGVVVDAAGAWSDVVATMAGVPPVGLQPMRRTAFMVPGSAEYAEWPMVVDAGHRFYVKPDGVQLLCSLAEEVPDEPGDPRPRMEDVALAIDRINESTRLGIKTVNSQWTGLRTFAPDREMVIGEDPEAPGFFWLAGQGGTGIQTAPAYGALLAALVTDAGVPADLSAAGVDPAITSPARFRA